jgi:hypothetical protein
MYGLIIKLKDYCSMQVEVGEFESRCTVYKDKKELYSCMIPTSATQKLLEETDEKNIQVFDITPQRAKSAEHQTRNIC